MHTHVYQHMSNFSDKVNIFVELEEKIFQRMCFKKMNTYRALKTRVSNEMPFDSFFEVSAQVKIFKNENSACGS